jgi:hypothetical protein
MWSNQNYTKRTVLLAPNCQNNICIFLLIGDGLGCDSDEHGLRNFGVKIIKLFFVFAKLASLVLAQSIVRLELGAPLR